MRLLYVIDSLAPGGAETSLAELAPSLVTSGVDLHVLPLGPRGDLAPSLKQAGAVIHNHTSGSGRLHNVDVIRGVARRVRPQLIHTTLYESNLAGRVAARMSRIPVSTSIVGDTYGPARVGEVDAGKLRLALSLDRLTASYASRFHAVSESLAEAAVRDLRISRNIIDVIPRGRDAKRFLPRTERTRLGVRASLGVAPGTPLILTVGRLDPAKGHIDLIRALPTVVERLPEVVVLMAGKDGRAARDLRAAAEALRLPVRCLGHRDDIPDLMAAADVLCFPSLSEGSPGTLIEAMAVGCPIVASDIPANLEVLGTAGTTAVVTPVRRPIALATALLGALQDVDRVQAMTQQARERFKRSFQVEAVAARMASFFERARSQMTPPSRKVMPDAATH